MIKNIVFDFDGTIADSFETLLQLFNKSSDLYGFEKLDKKKIKYLMGKGAKYLIKYLKVPKYKIPFLMQEYRLKMEKNVENFKAFDGMRETLMSFYEKKYRLGILTSNSKENVEKFLKKNKLEYFNFIYHGSSLFGKDKMLRKMLKEQKINKDETIYVGDEDRDIEAAKKVGLKSAAVTWGFNSKKLLKSAKPDYLIDKPSELIKLVK